MAAVSSHFLCNTLLILIKMVLLLSSLLSTFILAGHISALLGCSSLYCHGCSTCTQDFDQETNRCVKPINQHRLDALDLVSWLKSVTFRNRISLRSFLFLQLSVITFCTCARRKRYIQCGPNSYSDLLTVFSQLAKSLCQLLSQTTYCATPGEKEIKGCLIINKKIITISNKTFHSMSPLELARRNYLYPIFVFFFYC